MARYHVEPLGKVLFPDPLSGSTGDPQSLNHYAYVKNDPINAVDLDRNDGRGRRSLRRWSDGTDMQLGLALTWIAVSSTPGAMVLVAMALFNVKLRHVVASGRVVTVAVIYFTKTMWKEKATPTILHYDICWPH